MRVAEVKVKQEGDKKIFRWDNPIVHSKKPKGTAVTTPVQAEELARLRRGRKIGFNDLIDALKWEEQFDSELFPDTDSVAQAILNLFGLEPVSKPYSSNSELPKSVRNVLPAKAQTIFRKAFNSASQYPEARRMKIAWAAVKNAGYHKGADGKWTS
jgi:cation transport regulator